MEQLETEKKSEKIIEETENTNLQPDTPKRKWGWFIAGGILLISLIAGAVYYNSLQTEATNEDLAYGVLANNDNPQDYKDFLTNFPNSPRTTEVKQRLEKLERMLDSWNKIALSDKVGDFVQFKEQFDDTHFNHLCDIKIDSLDYITAQRIGTPAAFQDYLNAHPDGRYTSEASVAEGNLKSQEISEEETAAIQDVVNVFFQGFANQDETSICSNITATMQKFLSQKDVTKGMVVSTIKGMFNEHIQGCEFIVNRDMSIKRQTDPTRGYIVNCTIDQHIQRDDEGKTFGSYNCQMELTPQMLISSLTLDEISNR